MASFPTRAPSKDYYAQSLHKRQFRTKFNSGIVQSRAAETRARKQFTTGWKALPDSEYQELLLFFDGYGGKTFYWNDPFGNTYLVRFSQDALPKAKEGGWVAEGFAWDTGAIELEEA